MGQRTSSAKQLTRRDLIKAACVAAGATTLPSLSPSTARAAEPRRPNVVFILLDDLRYDALGSLGTPFLKTPNLDRVRNEGVHFKNAFVTISLCAPSRACFLTGTYAHTHGVVRNDGSEFDPLKTPTFPQLLQQAGYSTAHVGKWHMGRHANPRPGFDYWLSFPGQGQYLDPDLNENGRAFKAKGYVTDLLTEYAIRWLKQGRDPNKPFCLSIAHKAVHEPCTPAQRHQGLYADAEIPKPATWDDPLADKPAWQRIDPVQAWTQEVIRSSQKSQLMPDRLQPMPWDSRKRNYLDYYRTLQAVDDEVGQILQTLTELGELDNTIILFASDNGYLMGEHRRGDKRVAYEESMRIPLLMRYPKLATAGSTVGGMVLNIDVAPTILDLAGVQVPTGMQGRSVRPLLENDQSEWRKSFLYEYWMDLTPTIPKMVGVRTAQWKYVRYPDIDDLDELYDLKNDPLERTNLAQTPACAKEKAAMVAELERLMKETAYPSEVDANDKRPRGLILDYSFSRIDEKAKTVADGSGHGNDGVFGRPRPRIVPGQKGKAAEFSGQEWIQIPRSESLDPSSSPWVVEAWIKAADDGVILAHGGGARGYLLGVEKGIPVFLMRHGRRLIIVEGRDKCLGQWTHVAASMTGKAARLYVNGVLIDSLPLMEPIPMRPNDGLSIGRDIGPLVAEELFAKGFRGLIERVRIHRMEIDAQQVRKLFGGQ